MSENTPFEVAQRMHKHPAATAIMSHLAERYCWENAAAAAELIDKYDRQALRIARRADESATVLMEETGPGQPPAAVNSLLAGRVKVVE